MNQKLKLALGVIALTVGMGAMQLAAADSDHGKPEKPHAEKPHSEKPHSEKPHSGKPEKPHVEKPESKR
jgi:hypothetical protein